MNLLENFDKLNDKLTNLLEESKGLKQQLKDVQEENQKLKEKLEEKEKEDSKKIKQQYRNLPKENQELKKKLEEKDNFILNLENQKKKLDEKVLNLENQNNEQFEVISQNLVKALGRLGLDNDDENIIKEKIIDKEPKTIIEPKTAILTTLPPIDNDDKQDIESSSEHSSISSIKDLDDDDDDTDEPLNHSNGSNGSAGDDIQVIVGLDFGVTYSGFSYCHTDAIQKIFTNDKWSGDDCKGFKINTALQYDSNFTNVENWGCSALYKRSSRRNKSDSKPVELFKLHLGNLPEDLRPKLQIDYKMAITDYFAEIGKVIKKMVTERWKDIDFLKNVLLVLTVPAEFSEKDNAILRECAYYAQLVGNKYSNKLQFITESEAAAIYCMENLLQKYDPLNIGTTFMIVDCGGSTVSLTTCKLLENKRLDEVTERVGDFCGSSFVDKEFVSFLRDKLGAHSVDLLSKHQYGQMQQTIQEFCRKIKEPFTGDDLGYRYEIDLMEVCPSLKLYIMGEAKNELEEEEWIIEFDYDMVIAMFDPVIDKIIRLIRNQISVTECSVLFLVGGFCESQYLQKRLKQEFQDKLIFIPNDPITAMSCGAVMFGSTSIVNFNGVDSQRTQEYFY